ncbi:38.7 kDa protein [Spodoptera litura nucleopolyhedrovirus]|uniref:38.7 kDa protein n=1 Tax=Spodoptera litura multicapsid nucleopolyhedrovirus TaxID=46242 RepID=Q91BA6_NPVST|nr:38.7 kDa protein [Spodoptera litura nucleopolyhedrovirus]AAL01810.1 38.7 kDa protein [Spodoptera litura nucleopolyhedrovirus]QHN73975.1 38.7k [Spodoptera litura nucleopolyhedrovirus]
MNMFKNFIQKTFSILKTDYDDDEEEFHITPSSAKRLNRKLLNFKNLFSFYVRYTIVEDTAWFIVYDFARGIGHNNVRDSHRYVERRYRRSLDQLLNNNEDTNDDTVWCIDKHGCLQLLDTIEDFEDKSNFTVWFLNDIVARLEKKDGEILNRILDSVEQIKRDDVAFRDTVVSNFKDYDIRLNSLNERIACLDRIDTLYDRLKEYTEHNKKQFPVTVSEQRDGQQRDGQWIDNTAIVRYPKDLSKRPHLCVLIETHENGGATVIKFITGQHQYCDRQYRKRKFGQQLVYDNVHPNPQLEFIRLCEELESKNYKITKLSRSSVRIDDLPFESAKSLVDNVIKI